MAAADIDVSERDAFVVHAENFDLDDNGYLKKAELEAAAKAWNANASGEEEVVAEEAVEESESEEASEEAVEESESEEVVEEPETSEKNCPICMAVNTPDAAACSVCSFTFQ
jgi:hypothetical protein